jgi:hypothetical protein
MYVSDKYNNKILKWIPYAKEGQLIVGGNSQGGNGTNQLSQPMRIKFDNNFNLYVTADSWNDRIQKFLFNTSSCIRKG